MPPPFHVPTNIPPAQEYKYTSIPPETLLWLHQLRREQSATLSRIKKIESSLEKLCSDSQSQARVQAEIQSSITSLSEIQAERQSTSNKSHDELKTKLEEVVRRIGDIQSDTDGLRKEESTRRAGWEETFEGRIGDVLRDGLKEGFERVMEREVENGTKVLEERKIQRSGGNGGGTTISTRISESARQWADRQPTALRASPTPTPPPDCNNDYDGDNIAAGRLGSETMASSTFTTPVSVQVGRKEGAGVMPSLNGESCHLVPRVCQNTQSLASYMEMGRSMLLRFPGAEQEAHIVRQFCEGLSDQAFRSMVIDKLNSKGWKWSVLEAEVEALSTNRHSGVGNTHVCASLNPPGGGDNSVMVGSHDTRDKEEETVGRKRRKRREIPIIWPDEEDEEEARLLAEIERRRLAYFTNTRQGRW